VPLMNTPDSLGFVGVYEDRLDDKKEEFDGPWGSCEKEATKLPIINPVPTIFFPRFLWMLLRFAPWTKSGPFDYSLPPLYWGEEEKKSN
jgi:hypothetical protein